MPTWNTLHATYKIIVVVNEGQLSQVSQFPKSSHSKNGELIPTSIDLRKDSTGLYNKKCYYILFSFRIRVDRLPFFAYLCFHEEVGS